MKLSDRTLCAGQGCDERGECVRYLKRGGHDWASLDIERLLKDGICYAKVTFLAGPATGPRRAGRPRKSERTYQGVHP